MRWISSTKSTSPSFMPERIAARSPAWVMAGPLVSRSGAVISWAMIIASVVLPRPGGPESSTWSGTRPRPRAASRTSPSCSRTRCWPTTSARVRGRSAASTARSSPSASAAVSVRRCSASWAARWSVGSMSGLAQRAQGRAEQRRDLRVVAGLGRDRLDRGVGLLGGPAQAHQGLEHLVLPRRGRAGRRTGPDVTHGSAEPVLQLEDDPLRPLLADAGDPREGLGVVGGDGHAQLVGREAGQDGLRQLGADPGRGLHELEADLLVLIEEAEDGQRVLADDHARGQGGGLAGAQGGERAGGAHELEADATHVEHGAVERDGGNLAADERDHRDPPRDWPWAAARAASIRAWAPPRQMWVMASASASAASAGLGGESSRRMRVTIAVTCALSARPLPETAALTSLGVCKAIGSPRRAAATRAMPLAWAVPMIVLESERANTRSTATASGWYSSSQASMPFSIVTSRWAIGRSALVRTTLTSINVRGRPTVPSTTPRPQRVSPGSIPSTRTRSPSRHDDPNRCSYER